MTEEKDMFARLDMEQYYEEALDWAEENCPQFLENEDLIAQLYYTADDGLKKDKIDLVEAETVAEVKNRASSWDFTDRERMNAVIRVVMVSLKEEPRPYFGCPACLKKADKELGYCTQRAKHEETDYNYNGPVGANGLPKGKTLRWDDWRAGDSTGNITVTISPYAWKAPEKIEKKILTLRGSMDEEGKFTAWDILREESMNSLSDFGDSVEKERGKFKVKKDAEEVPEKPDLEDDDFEEEMDDDEFFTGDEEAESIGYPFSGAKKQKLERLFKKMLKKHAKKNSPAKMENFVKFLEIRDGLKQLGEEERKEVAIRFIEDMDEYYELTDKDGDPYKKGKKYLVRA